MKSKIENIIIFLADVEKLKSTIRHCWTSTGRQESVAEHCWRLSLLALVIGPEFPKVDINKVMKMCIIHDLGEVYKGDTPAFDKTTIDDQNERNDLKKLLLPLSDDIQIEFLKLDEEFTACSTPEAKLAKALDKLEGLIQHNEADLSTWILKEHKLNLTYGDENIKYNEYLSTFREIVKQQSIEKMKNKE